MLDLLKETLKFQIKKRIGRGHGSWGFLFPAMLVLVLVLWTLRITVVTMEYQTAPGAEQSATETDATETDGEAATETDAMIADADETEATAAAANEGIMLVEESGDITTTEESSAQNETETDTSTSAVKGLLTAANGETIVYSAASCVYDESTGDFSVSLSIDFNLLETGSEYTYSEYDQTIVNTAGYENGYIITLPGDIIVPEDLLNTSYDGYLTNTKEKVFEYYFVANTDVNGNEDGTYSVVLVFSNDYLSTLNGDNISGNVSFSGYFSSEAYDKDSGSIIIKDGTGVLFSVDSSEITFTGSSTVTEDISVMKSGSYDSSAGTVTYTITVYSKKGTGDTVTLTDGFTDTGFSDILGDLVSVSYQTATVSLTVWNNTDMNVAVASTAQSQGIAAGSAGSAAAPYYYTDSSGNLCVVLGSLSGVSGYTGADGTYEADAYIVTYTYKVDPESEVVYSSTNSVIASTDYTAGTTDGTISATATSWLSVSGTTMIDKSGSYDSTAGTITWSIIVGDGTSDTVLGGYVLSDDMFSSLTASDIAITDASRAAVSSNSVLYCYKTVKTDQTGTVVTDSDGNPVYVYTDTAGNDVTDSISDYAIVVLLTDNSASGTDDTISEIIFNSGSQYTVTYTSSAASAWTSQYITNSATITYDGDDESKEGKSYSDSYSVWISGSGTNAFTKSYVSAVENTNGSGAVTSVTLTWSSSFTVPTAGIPKGTTFTDYATVYSGSGLHYITYDQAQAIITNLEAVWGSGNLSIEFCTNSDIWNTKETDWVSSGSIASGTNYYQFRFTTLVDIAYTSDTSVTAVTPSGSEYLANTLTYNYNTTASVSGYDTNIYYNTLTDGSTTKAAEYTWYEKVVKYGTDTSGYVSGTDSTSITTSVDSNGNFQVSWIVRLVIDDTTATYQVTDTLPVGVELSELSVSKSASNSGYSVVDSSSANPVTTALDGIGTFNYSSETETAAGGTAGTDDYQVVTLEISGISGGVSMLYIKYVCTYKAETGTDSYSLENSVNVTKDTADYGSDREITNVTLTTTTADTNDMTKSSAFDKANNTLTYTIDINPTSETYKNSDGEEYASLTVTDTLSYYTTPTTGFARDATLITNSILLYNVDTGEYLDSSEYSWVYAEDTVTYDWGYLMDYVTKTIVLTVPNGVHLKLEYQYLISIAYDGTEWTEDTTMVTNTAYLSAEGDSIYETQAVRDQSQLSEVKTTGTANSGSVGYTIYKVDAENFSVKLSGAVFTLYVYDSSTDSFVAAGNFTTGSGGYITVNGTPVVENGEVTCYTAAVSSNTSVSVPVNTICYLMETTAPENYKLDDTKYYFYFGTTVAQLASACTGYSSSAADAKNLVLSASTYVTNEHSSDYYAAKTSISVLKKWFDSNDESYEKSDGSVTLYLYRVLLKDGELVTTGSSGGGSGGSSGNNATLTWYLDDANAYNGYVSSGSKTVEKGATVTFSVYYTGIYVSTYGNYYIGATLTDGDGNTMATINAGSTFSYTISDENVVTKIESSGQYYIFTLTVSDSMEITCAMQDWNALSYVYTATATTDSESGASGTGGTTNNTVTVASDSDTIYRLSFSELHEKDAYKGNDGNYGDLDISGNYGWTTENASHSTDGSDGFFTISGTSASYDYKAHLSASHGTAAWDVDGDGTVDTGEESLYACLKMENGAGTTIAFTSASGGYLTMVFGTDGSGNTVKLTETTSGETTVLSPNTTTNVIYQYLAEGTYQITYNQSCYLFYIDFAEGATAPADESDEKLHNFNDGTNSDYYTILGSLSYNYGTIDYGDVIASQCLKMNSSASVTFTATEAGTIYLILTNPKAASKVGVTLDGEEVYATATTTADSKGYRIYTVMQRVEAGAHTITRINGTEVMLYYVAYMADDYGGNSWGKDEKSTYLALTDDSGVLDETTRNSYIAAAEYVQTITLSASTDWSWYSSSLASECIDMETGEVLGEYYYYLVEAAVNGNENYSGTYTVAYLNDDGIKYGSIGISNTIVSTSTESTSITVSKSWVNEKGQDVSSTYGTALASISYSLYAEMNLYSTATAEDLTSGSSISRTLSSSTEDGFYTVTSNGTAGSGVGSVTYEGTTYPYNASLKMNSTGTVSFDAPAKNGTLTLVFSAICKANASEGDLSQYGPAFKITFASGDIYDYLYDSANKKFSVYHNGKDVSTDPNNVTCTYYSADENVAVVQLSLESAGSYKISQFNVSGITKPECYLFYIEYAYQYCYLVDGILTQEGTITLGTTNTAGDSWLKTIGSLPKYIYNDAGTKVIGEYSYYVRETGVTLEINGAAQELTASSTGEYYSYSYEADEGGVTYTYTYTVKSEVSQESGATTTLSNGEKAAAYTITAGTMSVKNTVSVTTVSQTQQDEYVLPATGGTGTIPGYAAGILLLIASAIIAFRRNKWQGCE